MARPAREGSAGARAFGPLRQVIPGVAVTLALLSLFDGLVFEAFSIQTASMEPSLRGRLSAGDHVLVSRLHLLLFGLERFDPISFRYPNHQGVGYLKRIVGFPGEQVWIRGGDLWISDHAFGGTFEEGVRSGRITAARKPRALQETLFSAFEVRNSDYFRSLNAVTLPDVFAFEGLGPEGLSVEDGVIRVRSDVDWSMQYRHGVPDHLPGEDAAGNAAELDASVRGGTEEVGDLSVRVSILGVGSFFIEIVDPGTRSISRASLLRRSEAVTLQIEVDGRILGAVPCSVPALDWTRLRFDRADHQLSVYIDGDLMIARNDATIPTSLVQKSDRAGWSFGGSSGELSIRLDSLHRDLHYLRGDRDWFLVPPGMGVALGDNTIGSADSRAWKRVVVQDVASGALLTGDGAGVTAKEFLMHTTNPHEEIDGTHVFIDIEGREHRFRSSSDYRVVETLPTPYFRIDEIEGRCLAILFPWSRAGVFR